MSEVPDAVPPGLDYAVESEGSILKILKDNSIRRFRSLPFVENPDEGVAAYTLEDAIIDSIDALGISDSPFDLFKILASQTALAPSEYIREEDTEEAEDAEDLIAILNCQIVKEEILHDLPEILEEERQKETRLGS